MNFGFGTNMPIDDDDDELIDAGGGGGEMEALSIGESDGLNE
jgi:hypothetical protein